MQYYKIFKENGSLKSTAVSPFLATLCKEWTYHGYIEECNISSIEVYLNIFGDYHISKIVQYTDNGVIIHVDDGCQQEETNNRVSGITRVKKDGE